MKRFFISLCLSLAVAVPAFAQVATSTPRDQMRDMRREGVEMMRDTRQQFQQDVQQKRADLKTTIEAKRGEMKATMEAQREKLKQQLKKVKDERKKMAVERIDDRLSRINEQRTAHFTEVLEKIEKVLTNAIERTDKVQTARDVSPVRTAIANAKSAIQVTQDAIAVQAGKIYAITVTSEATLRSDTQKAVKSLQDDLNVVREQVKAAHQAVRQAAVALAQAARVKRDGTGTSSAPLLIPNATTTATTTNQ